MAGSSVCDVLEKDSLLANRLEGLKLLAEQISSPVVILSPSLSLLYANSAAQAVSKACPLLNEDFGLEDLSAEPCGLCPAKGIFQNFPDAGGDDCEGRYLPDEKKSCPFPKAFLIPGMEGRPGCALMMGEQPEESVVWKEGEKVMSPETEGIFGEVVFGNLIGKSSPIKELAEMVQLVAASEATVLIEGESGTGKELVAKTIHRLSPRRACPFVVVECSSLTETLLESELFGHVRGAFTGATCDRKGLFEEAEGGTIFLDEIADTSSAFQAKLLRVLQEGEIKPVGSNRSIKINVRVISACNKRLLDMIAINTFRPDLYYRLAVLPLKIPPLRNRKEDIPLLAQHFLHRACQVNKKSFLKLQKDAIRALVHYSWPGNVRELENLIERAVVTVRQSSISAQDLFGSIPVDHSPADLASVSKAAREEAEKDRILQALQETGGEKAGAARLLKISRANLYNKLRMYQIS